MTRPGSAQRPPAGRSARRRARVIAGLAALLIALATGCGVPLEQQATVTPAEELPYGLQDTPGLAGTVPAQGGNATIYLVADDLLRGVDRTVADLTDLSALLAELAEPLSEDETAQGLRRALNDPDLIGSVSRTSNLATVELTAGFDLLPPREQVLILGQIVFSLTELDVVDRVRFSRNGEPLAVPTGAGDVVDNPVTRYAYRSLR